ncbi:MAG: type II secretion system F family protein [Magnetococcales bacterium]|nr:type II secretion system F family protein [Magnetococcales bacterium]
MAIFYYRYIQPDGRRKTGVVQLPLIEVRDAQIFLEETGNTVILVRRLSRVMEKIVGTLLPLVQKPVKLDDLIMFLNNLSAMLKAGISLMDALRVGVDKKESPGMARTVEQLRLQLEAGTRFSDAVEKHRDVFPDSVCFLVRVGDETGTLERTLKDASKHLARVRNISANTQKVLIYPAMVFLSTLGAAGFWVYTVVPKMVGLFQQMDVDLPPITLFLLALSKFLEQYIVLVLVGIIVLFFVVKTLIKTNKNVRFRFHQLQLRLPVVRTLVQTSTLSFMSEYFNLLTSAGIDIIQCLKILSESLDNEVYARKINEVKEGILHGDSLGEGFARTGVFPSFVLEMIKVGEQSGTLPDQLEYIAEEYRERLQNLVDNLSEVIQPLAIFVVGGIFVFILAGLLLPIYTLISQVSTAV